MYNNEPFEEYIRQVLGYPNLSSNTSNNIIGNNVYESNNNYASNSRIQSRSEIEKCYPEIYNVIYPMITDKCSRTSGTITRETVEEISKEITATIEPSVNEVKVNIQNESMKNNSVTTSTANLRKTNEKSVAENRSSGSGNLCDLVKILVIRELLENNNNRPPFPPPSGPGPRPPFPPGGRPPVGPPPPPPRHRGYMDYNDIYEY